MEGKEVRFGVLTSSLWSVFTTAVSNGSVNGMIDSYLPISNLVLLILMDTGEVVFGGVGSGLYTMIGFIILTVFISGLMIGRTPEYLGKKIEPKEILLAVAICLATPFAVLIFGSITALLPGLLASISNVGAHGFSEFFYAFSSAGANNGSAMAGFFANTDILNVGLGLAMLVARFLPIVAVIAMAGLLARKKVVAQSSGTLNTESFLFTVLLVAVVVIVGALSFLPSLALGPIRDMLL
ncbi:MAG: potassium-transporting ATPase subunit KdpA [Firmicutes bacterium]|nr:potassium-transporting ATPase subunit KdpA [Bacillota bacterium]